MASPMPSCSKQTSRRAFAGCMEMDACEGTATWSVCSGSAGRTRPRAHWKSSGTRCSRRWISRFLRLSDRRARRRLSALVRHPLLSAHTRLVPALPHSFEQALRRAMDDVLGRRTDGLRPVADWRFGSLTTELPPVEQTILRLRNSLPRYANQILERARELV